MLLFVPKENNGVTTIESTMSTTTLDSIREALRVKEINLSLPKLKLSYSKNLKETLKSVSQLY